MSYTFRIWFTGLVHFVENRDPYAKCQLCAVLPYFDDHEAIIYGVEREPFCGKMQLRPGRSYGDPLDRQRVAFKISRVDDLPPAARDALYFPHGVLHQQDISGIFIDQNPDVVSVDPSPGSVRAQILVEGGYQFGYDFDLSVRRRWRMPETLTGYPFEVEVADPVFVDIRDVERVEIIAYDIPHGVERSLGVVQPGSNGLIEVLVSNRCEQDCELGPEDIYVEWLNGHHVRVWQVDNDFAAHYSLLNSATLEAIRKFLPETYETQGPRYPVPKSLLLDLEVAPHICLDVFREESLLSLAELFERELWKRASEKPEARLEDAERKSIHGFLDILNGLLAVTTGSGVGSGSDCLGSKGEARFMDLDAFIPAPSPLVDLAAFHKKASAIREGRAALRNTSPSSAAEQEPTAPRAKISPSAEAPAGTQKV